MCCRKKCAFRCVIWLLVSITLCANDALALELVTKGQGVPKMCLNGAFNRDGQCVCNPGYSEFNGNCFLQSTTGTMSPTACPEGTVLWKGFCHYKTLPPMPNIVPAQQKLVAVPPLRITIPIPELIDPLDPKHVEEDTEGGYNEPEVIVPPVQGHNLKLSFERVVNNQNIINNATTVHTHNVNNVMVHFSRKTPNGGVRTVVIRNNETTVYDESEHHPKMGQVGGLPSHGQQNATETECDDEPATTEAPNRELPCCTVVSPRVCQRQEDEWVCFHRKQYVCSTVCTSKVMYLRPRKPSYRKPWLVMPPRPNPFAPFRRCRWGQCPRLDCSGCMDDRAPCHPMCYTYDCMADNSCTFITRDLRCPDPSNDLCLLLEQKTIDLLKPTEADAQ
uniref:DUF4789 domain-containing protein n=1 Tax=Anopheles atroparvus TaxID=41427 RepID=A0AAG5CZG2_ANOAO